MVNSELYHWGIKNMKWGIRRFQNKDGSLTPLGRKRYSNNADTKSDAKSEETIESKRARLLTSNNAKELYENRSLLTTAELNERVSRLDAEDRLKAKLPKPEEKKKFESLDNAKEFIDKTSALYKSVDGAYSSVVNSTIGKQLAKTLGLDVPKKEFDYNNFLRNIKYKTNAEVREAKERQQNEQALRDGLAGKSNSRQQSRFVRGDGTYDYEEAYRNRGNLTTAEAQELATYLENMGKVNRNAPRNDEENRS